jgi:hypothetical protein
VREGELRLDVAGARDQTFIVVEIDKSSSLVTKDFRREQHSDSGVAKSGLNRCRLRLYHFADRFESSIQFQFGWWFRIRARSGVPSVRVVARSWRGIRSVRGCDGRCSSVSVGYHNATFVVVFNTKTELKADNDDGCPKKVRSSKLVKV